jgi:hypothetical protein
MNEIKDDTTKASPCWTMPSGQTRNYGRLNELFNRFRTICLDLSGHPASKDVPPELRNKIIKKFQEIQNEFHNNGKFKI